MIPRRWRSDLRPDRCRTRRHTRIRLLLEGEVPVPLFPDWTMGFEHVDDESLAEHVAGFIPATGYPLVNPDLISNAGIAVTLLTLICQEPGPVTSGPGAARNSSSVVDDSAFQNSEVELFSVGGLGRHPSAR